MEEYERLLSSGPKTYVGVPDPGAQRDGDAVLRQLAHDDPAQALAGRLVNCCQHLLGAAADCARAAWLQGDAAIWAVYRGGQRMVGQALVWRATDGRSLVLDSVECLRGHEETTAALMLRAARATLGRMCVSRVLVGGSGYGATRHLRELAQARRTEAATQPAFRMSYTDASQQYVVAEIETATEASPAPAGTHEVPHTEPDAAGQYDVLLPGSGVVCEYCDAEVHPDVEVCPSCGRDISQWVDDEEEEQEVAI